MTSTLALNRRAYSAAIRVVVDGLEIPSDRAVADLEVKGVSTGAHSAPRAIR